MSLDEVLHDLIKNTSNIDPSSKDIILENIDITEVKKENNKINIQYFSKETIERLNKMFNLIIIKQNIIEQPRIDRNTAMEIFTMIPNISKTEQAKLTNVPSIINKEIIDRVFNTNIDGKLSLDVIEKLYEVEHSIKQHLLIIDVLINYFRMFIDTIEHKVEVFKDTPPIVRVVTTYVYTEINNNNNCNINLFTEKIESILNIDDTKLLYPKYSGKLTNMYSDILYDKTLKSLGEHWHQTNFLSNVSLVIIFTISRGIINNLDQYRSDLNLYLNKLLNIIRQQKEINSDTIEIINGHKDVVTILEKIGSLKTIIETKDNCFDKTTKLIEFLD